MPFRTKDTYSTSKGTYNTKKKTFSGKGPAPAGMTKVRAKTIDEVPVVTVESDGTVTASGYSSPAASSRAVARQRKQSVRTERKLKRIKRQTLVKAGREKRQDRLASLDDIGEGISDLLGDAIREVGSAPRKVTGALQDAAVAAYELPKTKTTKAFGKPTLGTPTVGQVFKAKKAGTLKVNKGGKVTIPITRKANRELHKAKKEYAKKSTPVIEGLLTPDQQKFAEAFAKASGLPPKLAGDWTLKESGGSSAGAGGEAGEHNQLGIGYPGKPQPMSQSEYFNNTTPEQAGRNSAKWIRGEIGSKYDYVAADSIQAIDDLIKSGASDAEIRAYIAGPSAWGTGEIPNSPQVTVRGGKVPPKTAKRLKAAKEEAKKVGIPLGGKASTPTSPKLPEWALKGANAKGVKSAIEVLGRKPLEKWFAPTNSGTAGYFKNVANLNPVLARQMMKVAKASGEPITVTSGYRSMQNQEEIDSGTNPKAAVGYSEHQFGMAADTEMSANQESLLAKFGLQKGSGGPGSPGNDPPHTSLVDQTLIKEAMKYGPIRAAWGPEEWNSVGDLGDFSLPSDFGAPATGSYSGGSTSSGVSSAQVSAYATSTGESPAQVKKKLKNGKLTVKEVRDAKLEKVQGVRKSFDARRKALEDTASGAVADSQLADLKRRYGSPAV